MRCVNTKPVGTDPKTGKQLVEAMIIADTEPENLPTTGEGIIGMSESEVFAPFSLILCWLRMPSTKSTLPVKRVSSSASKEAASCNFLM